MLPWPPILGCCCAAAGRAAGQWLLPACATRGLWAGRVAWCRRQPRWKRAGLRTGLFCIHWVHIAQEWWGWRLSCWTALQHIAECPHIRGKACQAAFTECPGRCHADGKQLSVCALSRHLLCKASWSHRPTLAASCPEERPQKVQQVVHLHSFSPTHCTHAAGLHHRAA